MAHYRDVDKSSLGAMQYGDSSGGTPYAAKPTPTDFRCDVDKVILQFVDDVIPLSKFLEAYIHYDSIDEIDMEIHAAKIIGNTRSIFEERLGAAFIRRKIFPTTGKNGYFHTVRRAKWHVG